MHLPYQAVQHLLRCANLHLTPACCMQKHLSPFSLVIYSFKPLGVYLLLLYTSMIFPIVSVCLCAARFLASVFPAQKGTRVCGSACLSSPVPDYNEMMSHTSLACHWSSHNNNKTSRSAVVCCSLALVEALSASDVCCVIWQFYCMGACSHDEL